MDQKLVQDEPSSYGSTDNTIPEVSIEGSSFSNFDSIVNHIYTINSNCRFLEQASKAIGTTKDNVKLRNNVQSTLFNSKTLIDKTKTELQELIVSARSKEKPYRLQVEKLQNNFKDAVQIFSGLQKVLLIKLRRNLPTEPCPITHSEHKRVDYIYDDEEELLSLQQSFQKMLEDKQEQIIEREDALRKIESDVLDINDIMRDLGTMIQSQSDTVDLIENVVEEAHVNVEAGRQEIEKAAEYQRKRKRKLVYLLWLLLIVVSVFSVLLYLALHQ